MGLGGVHVSVLSACGNPCSISIRHHHLYSALHLALYFRTHGNVLPVCDWTSSPSHQSESCSVVGRRLIMVKQYAVSCTDYARELSVIIQVHEPPYSRIKFRFFSARSLCLMRQPACKIWCFVGETGACCQHVCQFCRQPAKLLVHTPLPVFISLHPVPVNCQYDHTCFIFIRFIPACTTARGNW